MKVYLEISPRRSGKTTRFIEAIKKWINEFHGYAIIFTHQYHETARLLRSCGLYNGWIINPLNVKNINDYVIYNKTFHPKSIINSFFDYNYWSSDSVKMIIPGAYYTGIWADCKFEKDLLEYNDNKYIRFDPDPDITLPNIKFNNSQYYSYSLPPVYWSSGATTAGSSSFNTTWTSSYTSWRYLEDE